MMEPPDVLNELDKHVPLDRLRPGTLKSVSAKLNPKKIITTDAKLPRDWMGLMELCELSGVDILKIQNCPDRSGEILKLWAQRDPKSATVDKFLSFLEQLDRFDIIDDITPSIVADIRLYHKPKEKSQNGDNFIITRDDVTSVSSVFAPQRYHAYVLYADEDIDFATELIERMERQYEMKFCVKDRDLVGGTFEHDAVMELISTRCNRLIVILSQAFLQSPANKFFTSFAQKIGLEQGKRKVIPCEYKMGYLPLPPELSCYFILKHQRANKLFDFWDRLKSSIISTDETAKKSIEYPQHSSLKSALHQTTTLSDYNKSANHVEFKSMVDFDNVGKEDTIPKNSPSASSSTQSFTASESKKNHGLINFILKLGKKPTANTNDGILAAENSLSSGNSGNSIGDMSVGEKSKKYQWRKIWIPKKDEKSSGNSNDVTDGSIKKPKAQKKMFARFTTRKTGVAITS